MSVTTVTEDLQQEIGKLKAHNEQLESDFGHKRARFMEIFKQKEDELTSCHNALDSLKSEKENAESELCKLKTEISDIKTATAIAETGREDEMNSLRRKYNEEIASMQHLIKEAVGQAQQATANKFQDELVQMQRQQDKLQAELTEAKKKLSQEREGFLDSIAKTLQKKVVRPHASVEDENLEESMKKAQEDAELLKSVIVPLEEEIASLKEQLAKSRQPHTELTQEGDFVEVSQAAAASPRVFCEEDSERLRELSKNLQTEKSSRSDLEMYVAVLSAQKSAIQNEAEKIRADLQEVMKLLEMEKRDHSDLKNTWQVATDQFLESQRLMMMDMRNMESLLSEEQQRQLEELKKADAEREVQERKVRELEETRLQSEEEARKSAEISVDQSDSSYDKSKGSLSSLVSDEFLKFESEDHKPSLLHRSQSNQSFSTQDQHFLDSGVHDTKSLSEDTMGDLANTSDIQVPVLTEAQQRALAESVMELKISDVALASVKAKTGSMSFEGKRLVSQHEWDMMEKELRSYRERLGKPCDMCKNYEAQLQQVQETVKEAQAQVRTLDRQLENERSTIKSLQKYTAELETSVKDSSLSAQNEISDLINQIEVSEASVQDMRRQMVQTQNELENEIKRLTEGRVAVQKELRKLEEENDKLIDKHSQHSQHLQEETINLPENPEDMQLLLLKYREDVIAAKVAKEYMEENLKSEIMFLKDQVVSEQQEKTTIEETLSTDISQLQEDLAILQSVKSELERQNKIRSETESKLRETENSLKSIQAKSKQLVGALQSQVEEHATARTKLEGQVQEQRMKIQGLQVDLDNSEAVQRDFVKLSQSLQIQLEKIRAAEHEVRWQHEEDLDECGNCKKNFDVLRRKHHCRHCGRIFCVDCLTKTVASGPNNRPSKVCDVCHTILVRDATPYFSSEPPQTPD